METSFQRPAQLFYLYSICIQCYQHPYKNIKCIKIMRGLLCAKMQSMHPVTFQILKTFRGLYPRTVFAGAHARTPVVRSSITRSPLHAVHPSTRVPIVPTVYIGLLYEMTTEGWVSVWTLFVLLTLEAETAPWGLGSPHPVRYPVKKVQFWGGV